MLAMMLDLHYKGLGLVIQHVGKEKALQIASEYDKLVFFPLLEYAYKVLNPIEINEKRPTFASQIIEFTNLYDLIETN
jgi:hypothetical protein